MGIATFWSILVAGTSGRAATLLKSSLHDRIRYQRIAVPSRWMFALIVLMAPLAGCASLDARPDQERSARAVEHATGAPHENLLLGTEAARNKTTELLAEGLTADEAVQVAMLNNPRVRAAMLSIGISRADFVQSTLFTNPELALALRFPDGGGLANFEAALTQNIAEMWLSPSRREAARRVLDRTVLEAARTVADVALEVRSAYARATLAERQQAVAEETLSDANELLELSRARQKAGTGTEIDTNLALSQQFDAQTAHRNAQLAVFEALSRLSRLLGHFDSPDALELHDDLPVPQAWPVTAEQLNAIACEHRLDLKIAKQTVAAAQARFQEERTRFIRQFELGLAMERMERRPDDPSNTDVIVGPTFGIELPIWDQNQARIARARHVLEQSRQLYDALRIDVAQDIHSALARVKFATDIARSYQEEQLPAAERNIALSREAYRTGRLSFLSLLEAQRTYTSARSGYLDALESAALALVDLERVTGRPADELLADTPESTSSPTTTRDASSASEVSP